VLELAGLMAMLLLGVVLGTIGAGGSILTVPILVYLFSMRPVHATGYSLAIVGTTALIGAGEYLRRGQADLPLALVFGTPAIAGVYVTRRFLVPAIPDPVLRLNGFLLGKDEAILLLFVVLMIGAGAAMLTERGGDPEPRAAGMHAPVPLIVGLGALVGLVTGLVGAGGGFLLLPVLVLLGGLPLKVAIGTDLLIIAAKSLIGFIGEAQVGIGIDWGFAATITVLSVAGVLAGARLNRRLPAARLKPAFGWFVLVVGLAMLGWELLAAWSRT
jgi:uncharacterized protein